VAIFFHPFCTAAKSLSAAALAIELEKRSRPVLPHIFDHYLFSTLEVYEWPAMYYCDAARAKNRSLIPVTTKIMAPKRKNCKLFMHIFGTVSIDFGLNLCYL
jgi:hypothetical protein